VTRRRLRSGLLSIALTLVTFTGCAHDPPAPIVLPAPQYAWPEELRWAIEAALAERRWTVMDRGPGRISAGVRSNGSGESAVVDIYYSRGSVEIRCAKQYVERSRYDRWIQLLSAEIQKDVALVGTRRGGPSSAASP
jgi:hypothetical protein